MTFGKLRDALRAKGKASKELAELYSLESDEQSWLSYAKEIRDYSTHVSGTIRKFHLGGHKDGQVWLHNPKTGQSIELHYVDELSDWLANMKELLERLRESAINEMHVTNSSWQDHTQHNIPKKHRNNAPEAWVSAFFFWFRAYTVLKPSPPPHLRVSHPLRSGTMSQTVGRATCSIKFVRDHVLI